MGITLRPFLQLLVVCPWPHDANVLFQGSDPLDPLSAEDWVRPVDVVNRYLKELHNSANRPRCDVPIIDGGTIEDLTWDKLQADGIIHEAALITGLSRHSKWLDPLAPQWERGRFVETYGNFTIWKNTGRFDELDPHVGVRIRDYVEDAGKSSVSTYSVGHDTAIEDALLHNSDFQVPTMFAKFIQHPAVDLAAAAASGSQLHSRKSSWHSLLHGTKVWWFASSDDSPKDVMAESKRHTAHPCSWLDEKNTAPSGLKVCVQRPGETMYLGNHWYRAVCNLEDFTLGIGGRGHWKDKAKALHDAKVQPAHHAALNGHVALLKKLAIEHADLLARGPFNRQPLSWAVEGGHAAAARFLIDKGSELDSKDSRVNFQEWETLLHKAAKFGHEEVADVLIDKGLKGTMKDFDDRTPLQSAVVHGHTKLTVRLLRETTPRDASRGGALQDAAAYGHVPVMTALLTVRVNPNTETKAHPPALHIAAKHGHAPMLEYLLNQRVSVSLPVRGEQAAEMVGASPRGQALHVAAEFGKEKAMKFLLEARADVNARDLQQHSPLIAAAKSKFRSAAELLSRWGAKVDLDELPGERHAEIVRWLRAVGLLDKPTYEGSRAHKEL